MRLVELQVGDHHRRAHAEPEALRRKALRHRTQEPRVSGFTVGLGKPVVIVCQSERFAPVIVPRKFPWVVCKFLPLMVERRYGRTQIM